MTRMSIIKNILIPLFVMTITSIGVVYYSYLFDFSTVVVFAGLVAFAYGFGSIYIYYYIFCKVFPDIDNKPTPPSVDFFIKCLKVNFQKDKIRQLVKPKKTKAFKIASVFSVITMLSGIILLFVWSDNYKKKQLSKYGTVTVGIVLESSSYYTKKGYLQFIFYDKSGNKHLDIVDDDKFKVGDSLQVFYSSERPEFNVALKLPHITTITY